MQRRTRFAALGLMVGVFLLLTAARLNAQVQTDTQTTAGNASKTVQVPPALAGFGFGKIEVDAPFEGVLPVGARLKKAVANG